MQLAFVSTHTTSLRLATHPFRQSSVSLRAKHNASRVAGRPRAISARLHDHPHATSRPTRHTATVPAAPKAGNGTPPASPASKPSAFAAAAAAATTALAALLYPLHAVLAQAAAVVDDPAAAADAAAAAAADLSDLPEAARDTSTLSRVLVIITFGLLLLATVGTIVLGIDRFITRRNDKRERKLVQDFLDGKDVPQGRWRLDMGPDGPPPKPWRFPPDFPYKPKAGVAMGVTGNRESRRASDKIRAKDLARERKKKAMEKRRAKKAEESGKTDSS